MRTLFVVILLIINVFVVKAQYNNNSNFKGYVGISIPELLNVGVIKIIEDNYHVGGGLGGAYIFGVLWKTINVEQRFYYGKIQKGAPHKSFFIKHGLGYSLPGNELSTSLILGYDRAITSNSGITFLIGAKYILLEDSKLVLGSSSNKVVTSIGILYYTKLPKLKTFKKGNRNCKAYD